MTFIDRHASPWHGEDRWKDHLTLKRQARLSAAAANGSNRIALRCPQPTDSDRLTCVDDLY
jgi:hypothetical protein